jgi:hypothetical protein
VKKLWLGFSIVFICSLMVVGLSGCYYRDHNEHYRKDRGDHDDNRRDDKHDDKDNRGGEQGDRDRR